MKSPEPKVHMPRLRVDSRKTWCGLRVRSQKTSNDPEVVTCKNCARVRDEFYKRRPSRAKSNRLSLANKLSEEMDAIMMKDQEVRQIEAFSLACVGLHIEPETGESLLDELADWENS